MSHGMSAYGSGYLSMDFIVCQFQLGVHVICCLDELCVTWYECLWQRIPFYGLYCVSE